MKICLDFENGKTNGGPAGVSRHIYDASGELGFPLTKLREYKVQTNT
jgi:hypothetical protein